MKQFLTTQREQLEADVLIVGAGPAGGGSARCIWRTLIKEAQRSNGASKTGRLFSRRRQFTFRKRTRGIGAHQLWAAIMNQSAGGARAGF